MPITKSDVDRMGAGATLWDSGKGSVTGFGVRLQRVTPVFVLKYTQIGRARWHTIGKFGSPWTVDMARQEARRLLGLIVAGEDIAAAKRASRMAALTMGDLCDQYMAAAKAGMILTRFNRPKKASTLEIDEGRILRHIKPLVGSVAVADFDSRAVRRLIQDITIGKTAVTVKTKPRGRALVTGGPGTAARVAELLSGIMSWAIEEEIVVINPVHRVRRYRGEPRQRFLSEEELRRLGERLTLGTDDDGKAFNPFAVAIVWLLCVTGGRLGEIEGLRWCEVYLEQSCLRLDDTKTGQSLRAIGRAVVERLRALPRFGGSPYVFPASRSAGHYEGAPREIKRIFAAAGIEGASSHTLRHTFASHASGLGYSEATIAGLLGHKGRGITSRYVHRPDSALAAAAEAISCHIRNLMREVAQPTQHG